jgi:hypothetical protein
MRFKDIEKKIVDGQKLTEEEREFSVNKVGDYWDNHPDVVNRYPRWRKYIAWVAGYQLYDYNKAAKRLVEVPVDRERKLIINKLKPYVRTLLSKLTADVPQMSIIPNTTEDNDIRAARVGDKVIEGLSEKLGFDQTMANVKLWTIICNRAFLRVFWNKDDKGVVGYKAPEKVLGDGVVPGPEELAGTAEPSPDAPETEPVTEEGDIGIECISPFNCRVDPLYFDRDKWRWFIFGDEVDAEDLEDEYNLKRGVLKEQGDTMERAYDLESHDELELQVGDPAKDEKVMGRTVVKKYFYTPKIYMILAGTKVLEYGPNEDGEIPFFAIEDRLIPISNYEKEFTYNESLVKDAIPLQREINRQAAIMSLALDRASKLKILTPLGSLMSKKQWVNDYGVFIDYNRNAGDPYQMKLDPFPVEMPAYKNSLEADMQSTMSLGPASFGQLPERASHASGSLVNLLLEQDDVILNPLLNHINHVIGEAWSLAMRLVQKNYAVSRLIKTVGDDSGEDVMKFHGAQLKGNTDVRVVSQAGLPRSRALRIEYLMKLREVGLLKDDRSTLEMLEFGNADKIFKDEMVHEKKASRENSIIFNDPAIEAQGTVGWVYPYEDHAAHLKIHWRERLGVRYEQLNDNQKAALDTHIEAHIAQVRAQMPPPPVPPGNEPGGGTPAGQPTPPETPQPGM